MSDFPFKTKNPILINAWLREYNRLGRIPGKNDKTPKPKKNSVKKPIVKKPSGGWKTEKRSQKVKKTNSRKYLSSDYRINKLQTKSVGKQSGTHLPKGYGSYVAKSPDKNVIFEKNISTYFGVPSWKLAVVVTLIVFLVIVIWRTSNSKNVDDTDLLLENNHTF